MKRRDFLKLSAAPIVIPWVPKFTVTKAHIPEWTDFPDSNPISDIERYQAELIELPKYDTLTVTADITDDSVCSVDIQEAIIAYGIFESPSGKILTNKAELKRNSTWTLTTVTTTVNLIETGWWKCQMKIILPNNQVYITKETMHNVMVID